MKREKFIELWLEALESGKYKQTKDRLREQKAPGRYAYCCLGVACDVANKVGARRVREGVLDESSMLPNNMQSLIGIDYSGSFEEEVHYRGGVYANLTQLNDAGVNFKAIARIIREQMAKGNFQKP